MGFQSGINQLLGVGAIFSQLPGGQQLAEQRQWERDWKKLEKTEAKLGLTTRDLSKPEGQQSSVNPISSEQQALQAERVVGQRERLLDRAASQGMRNLSAENIQHQVRNQGLINQYNQAMKNWQDPALQQIQQKENLGVFMETLRNNQAMFNSLRGGK